MEIQSPPEVPHMSRRTLMSPQKCEIARCSPNQLEMKTNSPAFGFRAMPHTPSYRTFGLASSGQLQSFPETPISRLWEHQFEHRNSRKAPCTPYCLEKRADSQDSIKDVGHLPTSTSRGAFLRNRYVRGTLNLLPHVHWIPKFPDLEESRIYLQWLECRLVFHLTR